MLSLTTLVPLAILAALLCGGVIAQVVIETWLGRPVEVNPVLASLATLAITALFGQQSFLGHTAAATMQRRDLLTVIPGSQPMASDIGGSGSGTGGAAPPILPIPGRAPNE